MLYQRAPLGFPPADPGACVELVAKLTRRFKPTRLVVASTAAEGIERIDLVGGYEGSVPIVSGPPEAFSENVEHPVFPDCAFFDAGQEFRARVLCSTSRRRRLEGIVLIGLVEVPD